MKKRIYRMLLKLLSNFCDHEGKQIIAFVKKYANTDPCATVSYKYDVTTRWKCPQCQRERQEYTTE